LHPPGEIAAFRPYIRKRRHVTFPDAAVVSPYRSDAPDISDRAHDERTS